MVNFLKLGYTTDSMVIVHTVFCTFKECNVKAMVEKEIRLGGYFGSYDCN
jgi:hypothetical protein